MVELLQTRILTFDDPFGRWQLIIRWGHLSLCAHKKSNAVPSMAQNKHDFPSITPYLSPRHSFKMAITTQHLHTVYVHCASRLRNFLLPWDLHTRRTDFQSTGHLLRKECCRMFSFGQAWNARKKCIHVHLPHQKPSQLAHAAPARQACPTGWSSDTVNLTLCRPSARIGFTQREGWDHRHSPIEIAHTPRSDLACVESCLSSLQNPKTILWQSVWTVKCCRPCKPLLTPLFYWFTQHAFGVSTGTHTP